MRKVFSCIRRIRGKYLCIHEEYDEVRVVCGKKNVSEYVDCAFKLFRKIRRKYLSAYGANAKRILQYSPNTPRYIKLSKV
jgi:uncharacterized protein YjhX (UPF0386 family)